jgi:hypothetical protein
MYCNLYIKLYNQIIIIILYLFQMCFKQPAATTKLSTFSSAVLTGIRISPTPAPAWTRTNRVIVLAVARAKVTFCPRVRMMMMKVFVRHVDVTDLGFLQQKHPQDYLLGKADA